MARKMANQHERRRMRQVRRGFTLLEVIVVVTIIALLAALVAPRVMDNIWKSKQKIGMTEIESLRQQVSLYLLDEGLSSIPDDFELDMLTMGDKPFIEPNALLDPWDRPYVLVIPGDIHIDFDIISYGEDGEPGGEGQNADIPLP